MRKIVEFANEADWLAWRAQGIGASDVPSVMGEGFHTPFELWRMKKGLVEKKQTEAMSLGKKHEVEAVCLLGSTLFGCRMVFTQQVAMESLEHPFLCCTLDGISKNEALICEVKCVKGASKKKHKIIPKKYYGQVQMQLFISEAASCFYAEYDIEDKSIWFDIVKPNKTYAKRMLRECQIFWDCVQSDQPPEKTDKERLEEEAPPVSNFVDWDELEEQYAKAKEMAKWSKSNLELIESQMIEAAKGIPSAGKKYVLQYAFREGALDLEAIPQLRGLNLSEYRKPPSKSLAIVERKCHNPSGCLV